MATGDIYRPRQQDTGIDVVGGRLDVGSSATQLIWNFCTSNQIRLINPNTGRWEIVQVATAPTAANTANDMSTVANALVVDRVYDVFAYWSSRTAINLAFAPWSFSSLTPYASATDGSYNTGTTTCTSTMTSDALPAPNATLADKTYSAGYEAFRAFDGVSSDANGWLTDNSAHPHNIRYDFGAGRATVINKYQIQARNHATPFCPLTFKLQGSISDGSTWVDLEAYRTISDPGQNQPTAYFTVMNSTAYRYYRLYITASAGATNYCGIGEMKLIQSTQLSSRYAPWVTGTSYKVGMRVYAVNGSAVLTTYSCISNHTGGTWATDRDSISPVLWIATTGTGDFLGLDIVDGVPVYANSGAYKGYRWLGIIYTYNNSNIVNFLDNVNYRYVSNFYNRKSKSVESSNPSSSWAYTMAMWEEAQGGSQQIKGRFVQATPNNLTMKASKTIGMPSVTSGAYASIGVNSSSDAPPNLSYMYTPTAGVITTTSVNFAIDVPSGFNWITEIEKGDGVHSCNFYGKTATSGAGAATTTIQS